MSRARPLSSLAFLVAGLVCLAMSLWPLASVFRSLFYSFYRNQHSCTRSYIDLSAQQRLRRLGVCFHHSHWPANTTNQAARNRTHRISLSASRRMSYIEGATLHGIGDLFPHYLRVVGRRSKAGGEARSHRPFSVSPIHLSDRNGIQRR